MARINLLPWREERRREQTRQFLVLLVVAAVIALGAVFGGKFYMEDRLEYQQERNARLKDAITEMEKRITEIEKLEDKRSKLLARKEIIEELQRDRSQMVHLFDELARTIPDGVYLTAVKQSGTQITLNGIAESSGRISTYMRNLEASKWLHEPQLVVIETVNRPDEGRVRQFTLHVSTKATEANQTDDVFAEGGAAQ